MRCSRNTRGILFHFLTLLLEIDNNLDRSLDLKITCSRKSGIMRVDLIRTEILEGTRLLEISCIRTAEYLKCSIFRGKTPDLTNRGMA